MGLILSILTFILALTSFIIIVIDSYRETIEMNKRHKEALDNIEQIKKLFEKGR